MKIGNLSIETPIFLAPMAGVTDYPFRVLCKEQGAGIVYSEFVSAHGIIRENLKTLQMIKFSDFERPIGIQIFGDSPEIMAEAAKQVENKFEPDIIDINYGCPVPKITKKGCWICCLTRSLFNG
jgi:tRNA-dihydrouridine synthase B